MTLVKRDIGELLVDNGQLSLEDLERAREERDKTGESMFLVLARLGLADESQVKNVLELEHGINYVLLKKVTPVPELLSLATESLCRQHQAVPIAKDNARLTLAIVTPSNQAALDAFKSRFGDLLIKPVVCIEDDLLAFLDRAYSATYAPRGDESEPRMAQAALLKVQQTPTRPLPAVLREEEVSEHATAEDMAIVFLANHILSNALSRGCTNIHIEPSEKQVFVHYRKDGVLFAARKLPRALLPLLVGRFKKMAEITTTERNVPLDGRLNVRISGKQLYFRLSIVPGAYGEHLVVWLD